MLLALTMSAILSAQGTVLAEQSSEISTEAGQDMTKGAVGGGMSSGERPATGPGNGEKPQGGPGEGSMPQGGPADGEMPQGGPGNGEKPQGGPGGDTGSGGPGGGQAAAEGQIGSWSMGGTDASTVDGNDYDYDAALYVTADGIDEEKSATDRITEGTYDDSGAEGVVISDSQAGDNGILVVDADYEIKDASIDLLTDADGTQTCDFSGKGTAIAVFGSEANVTVEDSTVHTAGVATMPLFADDGATVTVKNSTLQSDGGELYQEYLNSPSQTVMVAPPWILGIMGTSRCSNMMGSNTTTNVIDSETSAGAWAVLSTDAGSDMYLNVYNTSLTLNNADESQYLLQEEGGQISETKDNPYTENYGSGYGTYVIGDAVETFAGAKLNVGTYASIFTGGSAVYTSLEAGQTYQLLNSSGESTCEYTASEDEVTEINSDTFGFMAHKSSNKITLEKGTIVNSGFATFLVKTGGDNEQLTATVDDTTITNGGVLIQVMDNDDTTNGGMMDTDDEKNTNGGSQNMNPVHTEEAGFSTDEAQAGETQQTFTFTNGTYGGNLYNASGSDGLSGSALNVTLGDGAVLNGAAASTSAIHVTYDGSMALKENGCAAFDDESAAAEFAQQYQNTEFTINEYYDIGQAANLICDNGANDINIALTGDAEWNVTGTSLISSLSIEGDASVVIPAGVTLTVDGTDYTECTLTADSLA